MTADDIIHIIQVTVTHIYIYMYTFKAMMFSACLFEIISYVHLCSSRVGSGIAQRRVGHFELRCQP